MMVLVGVLALSGVGVASASATQPEFVNELGKEPVLKGLAIGGGQATFTSAGSEWKCGSSESKEGKITGSHSAAALFILKRCSLGNGAVCTSAGEPAGTIATKLLTGALYEGEGAKFVGAFWEPEGGKHTGLIAEFKCEFETLKWTGCVAGQVTPINKFVSSSSSFVFQTLLESSLIKYGSEEFTCGQKMDGVETRLQTTWHMTPAETIEIKA